MVAEHHTRSVLVIGSINEDIVLRVARLPHPGETLAAEELTRLPGGKGANQAVAAARAGARVRMLGRTGEDPAAQRQLDALRAAGVDVELVEQIAGTATGTAYITVDGDGENVIVVDQGANGRLGIAEVEAAEARIAEAAVVLAQLEVPVDCVARAVELARGHEVRPVVTLSPAQPVPDTLLEGLDPLLVNEHEARFLLNAGDELATEEVAERLLGLGPRSVVITLGERGAVYADREGVRRAPAHSVEFVRDTTGAGDAFAGALAAAIARGAGLPEAVDAGLAEGAAAVGRSGAR
jgi:ribokinase